MRALLRTTAIAWLVVSAAAASSWPPAGRVLVRSGDDRSSLRIEAFTPAGNLVVDRHVQLNRGTYSTCGPVTIHDPDTGRLISTALTGSDRVTQVHWTGRWAVAWRTSSTVLVSLDDGKTLVEHPHPANARFRSGAISPSGAKFLVEAEDGVAVWDLSPVRHLSTFRELKSPVFGDDDTFYAYRSRTPIPTPNGRIQHETVRVSISEGTVTKSERRPIYDCGAGICSESGRYGVSFSWSFPPEGLSVFDNGRMELLWKLDLRRTEPRFAFFENPGVSFSDDSEEVRLSYKAGQHAIGVARWRTRDGTPLSPLPAETERVVGFAATSPDMRWSARWGHREERLPGWIPKSIQKWLLSTAPALMKKIAPDRRIEIIDNRRDRIATAIPEDANSVRFSPDSAAVLVDNRKEITRYPVPSGRLTAWFLCGLAPTAVLFGLTGKRRRIVIEDQAAITTAESDASQNA